jgi:hypothetical protein
LDTIRKDYLDLAKTARAELKSRGKK